MGIPRAVYAAALAQQATTWQAQQQLGMQVGILDGAVRTHHRGLQEARPLISAGLTRIQQHIEKTRVKGGAKLDHPAVEWRG